jgi:hypothetical protein
MSAVLEKSYTEKAFRYDIETYHKLSATGILPRNTELIHGVVVNKMTISPKHSKVVTKLGPILAQAISEKYHCSPGKTNHNWRLNQISRL